MKTAPSPTPMATRCLGIIALLIILLLSPLDAKADSNPPTNTPVPTQEPTATPEPPDTPEPTEVPTNAPANNIMQGGENTLTPTPTSIFDGFEDHLYLNLCLVGVIILSLAGIIGVIVYVGYQRSSETT
ncbi:MAG: hypothetical protein U9Q82_02630 [Chloroflexota bacterium]|nr:hypothetical protein [Chloroflexota bacterium]